MWELLPIADVYGEISELVINGEPEKAAPRFWYSCKKTNAAPERQVGAAPAYIRLGMDFAPKASAYDMLAQIKAFWTRKSTMLPGQFRVN